MFDWTKFSEDPNNEQMLRQWVRHYEENIVRFDLFSSVVRDDRVLDLCGLLNTDSSKKLLDVGFAEHGLQYAKENNWFHRKLRLDSRHIVYGLDVNKRAVDDIQGLTGYSNLIVGDATDKSALVGGGGFDVIHAGDIIEHLCDIGGFLQFCKNNLKRGGRIVITTPNVLCRSSFTTYKQMGVIANMEHTCWITPTNMNELCRRADLIFAESHYVMNKKRSLKNLLRQRHLRKIKDFYFTEFMYVLEYK